MQKTKQNKKLGLRVVAAVLAFAIIAPMPGIFGTNAAATSLSGIEKIKSRGRFSILEIVPQDGTGSIGYYVGGQEPTANWLQEVASISGDQTKSGPQKRKEYADNLFALLGPQGTGLMGGAGTSTDYPLVQTGSYQEYLPWASNIPDDAVEVSLDYTDDVTVYGTFVLDTSGDYIKNSTYEVDTTNGTHVEKALYYEYDDSADEANYYRVNFERVILNERNITNFLDKNIPLYVLKTDKAIPYYDYAGTLTSTGNFTIDMDINNEFNDPTKEDGFGYFVGTVNLKEAPVITDKWEPSELKEVDFATEEIPLGTTLFVEKEGKYVPVLVHEKFGPAKETKYYKLVTDNYSYSAVNPAGAYRPVTGDEKGAFKELVGFRYVGNNALDNKTSYYSFQSGTDPQTVTYDMIYVSGGYTNSEWFKRDVLDIPNDRISAFRLTVNSVTPEYLNNLSATMLENTVASYDLVVVSAGFYLPRNNNSSATYEAGDPIEYRTDVSAAVAAALSTKPRVVDTRIYGTSSRLAQLKDGDVAPAVTENDVYNFAVDDVRSALATNQFRTAFGNTAPYAAVLDEITYENQLRSDSDDKLSTVISMASCIRYIINTHRTINHKTSLRVLDIQPVPRYDGSTGPLTVDRVKSWLPEDSHAQFGDNITITHMSTAALIGKVEDITEQYDLIYIGADVDTNHATDQSYLAKLPSGMYYSNIGEKETVSGYLAGLLDNDVIHTAYRDGYSDTRYSGNDLTPAMQKDLLAFANARMPIIVSDELIDNDDARPVSRLSATITVDGAQLTAGAVLSPRIDITGQPTYQWYRKASNSNSFTSTFTGSQNQSITPSNGSTYYCEVTVWVDGVPYTATTNQITTTVSWVDKHFEKKTSGNYTEWSCSDPSRVEWFDEKTITPSAWENRLSASMGSEDDLSYDRVQSYQWYKVNSVTDVGEIQNGHTNYRINLGNNNYNTYYYCVMRVTGWIGYTQYDLNYTSPAYKLVPDGNSVTGTEASTGSSATIPAGVAGDNSLDERHIDVNSLLYKTLDSVWNKSTHPNVMAEDSVVLEAGENSTEVNEKRNELLFYLNLSRPSIVWYEDIDEDENTGPAAKPVEYNGTTISAANANAYDCEGNLYFNFHITNPTDPNPLMARYSCNLYIDQNGDGRHTDDELIGIDYIGRYVGDVDEGHTQIVPNGALAAIDDNLTPITYTVQKTVDPQKFSGLVAWKLEVVKVDDEAAHASQVGFAYIKPDNPKTTVVERTKIKVLQITTSNHFFNNSTHPDLTDSDFQRLYDQLYQAGMYEITVDQKSTSALRNKATVDAAYAEIKDYEMIIIGFGDCYGELDDNAALAVVQYIGTGKAVLFTHDTTSYWNLEGENVEGALGGLVTLNSHPYWGYTFNTIVRDKVGLDRYGVTNSNLLSDLYDNISDADDNPLDNGEDGWINSKAAWDRISGAGYSHAYVPGSAESSGATQGFTNAIIDQYKGKGKTAGNNPETSTVSRVNRGQITEYPYRLGDSFPIATTHSQYYQLNMNADDVVVWYCLSGDNKFAEQVNDVTNAYYIYNRDNITYSGAGHRPKLGQRDFYGNLTDDSELRLFVNTMIAAYRAGNTPPTINFTTADGENNAPTLLVPTEFSQTKDNSGNEKITSTIVGNDLDIYFKLQDTNLTAKKSIAVELYYDQVVDGNVTGTKLKATLNPIYRVVDGEEAVATNLTSGILYTTTIPNGILSEFAKYTGADEYNIYLKVITTLNPGSSSSTYTGEDNLPLMKLGLLPLE